MIYLCTCVLTASSYLASDHASRCPHMKLSLTNDVLIAHADPKNVSCPLCHSALGPCWCGQLSAAAAGTDPCAAPGGEGAKQQAAGHQRRPTQACQHRAGAGRKTLHPVSGRAYQWSGLSGLSGHPGLHVCHCKGGTHRHPGHLCKGGTHRYPGHLCHVRFGMPVKVRELQSDQNMSKDRGHACDSSGLVQNDLWDTSRSSLFSRLNFLRWQLQAWTF